MAETKACGTCGEKKPLDEFEMIRNGHGSRSPRRHCRTCHNAKRRNDFDQKERQNARKRQRYAEQRPEPSTESHAGRGRRTATPAPLPTRDEMRAWYERGCRV